MSDIQVGTEIPELVLPPLTRTTLALYAGASGDHNPIHIDVDFARRAGEEDVFAHGMLSMAWLGRMLTAWQPQSRLRKFTTRFTAITRVGDVVSCSGKVVEILERDGEQLARCEIQARTQAGTQTLVGEALVVL